MSDLKAQFADRIIDGKAFAEGLRARIGAAVSEIKAAHGLNPSLAVVLVVGVVVAYVLLLFPRHQYNLDVLALVTPVNLAVAAYLCRNK